MNRGQIFYSSLVQQMIGGDQNNSNLWIDMNSSSSRPNLEENQNTATLNPLSQFAPAASYFLPVMHAPWQENQDQPESLSLSQLLLLVSLSLSVSIQKLTKKRKLDNKPMDLFFFFWIYLFVLIESQFLYMVLDP